MMRVLKGGVCMCDDGDDDAETRAEWATCTRTSLAPVRMMPALGFRVLMSCGVDCVECALVAQRGLRRCRRAKKQNDWIVNATRGRDIP